MPVVEDEITVFLEELLRIKRSELKASVKLLGERKREKKREGEKKEKEKGRTGGMREEK